MIRASALHMAEKCGLSPALAAQYPETSDAAQLGKDVHEDMARHIAGGKPSSLGALALGAVRQALGVQAMDTIAFLVEHLVTLRDPESDEVITQGTADLVVEHDRVMHIFDWKTGRRENVPPPDDNPQLMAYGLAASLGGMVHAFQGHLGFIDVEAGTVEVVSGPVWTQDEWWPLLDRMKKAASREPSATPGEHCTRCYQRAVCPSWRERTALALANMPATTAIETPADALRLLDMRAVAETWDKAAELLLKAYVTDHGPIARDDGKAWGPAMARGRKSGPSVDELEANGMGHLVKLGKPYPRWGWSKS